MDVAIGEDGKIIFRVKICGSERGDIYMFIGNVDWRD